MGNGKTKSQFTADKLVLNIKNIGGHENWTFASNEVLLVDGEGFIFNITTVLVTFLVF